VSQLDKKRTYIETLLYTYEEQLNREMMKMRTKAVLIVMVALIGFCFFAQVVSAETAEEWNKEGISFGKAGNYEKAIECYNKTIELDPNYAGAYNNRGIAYAKLGHYERAMEDFEKVIELNQTPGILEKVVTDQSQNIMVESSLNYDINLNGSARATIYIAIININKYDLWLEFLEFKVRDEHRDINNVEIQVPYNQTFLKSKCSYVDRFENLSPYTFCYDEQRKKGIWHKYFCVNINKTLLSGKVTHLYLSYSIDNFTADFKNDTNFLHVPYQHFYNVRVSRCKGFSWDNVQGSDNESLLEILREDLNITWTENATISKNNNDTIIISSKDEQHSAKIIMDENRCKAILEIRDGEIRYLWIKEVDRKINLYIYDNQHTTLKTKDYNVLLNLPRDRYHYSKLLAVPHPHPDEIFMNEKSPTLSWHFAPNNRNVTHLLILAYKIQKDSLMIALDTFVLLSLALGIISIILAVRDNKHKRWKLIIIPVAISVGAVIIMEYILFTGLWKIYWELLLENRLMLLIFAIILGFITAILVFKGYQHKWILICSIAVVISDLIIILFFTYF
jgi:tetratricopeptide (TPR) repeat protein